MRKRDMKSLWLVASALAATLSVLTAVRASAGELRKSLADANGSVA